ncbi:MAG TPA: tripartite tricarboxylate transporter TctB family protein [Burkholderiales bacterium]|nr:tripartite tricarboxylate transporter TctB family protein [Burkholderiales bacterium]
MSTRLARALPYALVGLASAYLYYVAAHIEYEHRAGTLGPDFWPKLVLALAIAVCLFEIARVALSGGRGAVGEIAQLAERAAPGEEAPAPPPESLPRLAAGIALTALYVWLLGPLGFFCATVPYLAAFVVLGGYRRRGVVAAVSGLGTLLMMFFFMKVVYVSLPLGEGAFREVTLFLMRTMGIR